MRTRYPNANSSQQEFDAALRTARVRPQLLMPRLRITLGMLLLVTQSLPAATITIRSGNGSIGGVDPVVHMLVGPSTGPFNHVFGPSDFAAAQNGAGAYITLPNSFWIQNLSADPSAKWVSTVANSTGVVGNTALYAESFQISGAFAAATLAVNYAVDDGIGEPFSGGVNSGIYLNGSAVCGSGYVDGSTQQHSINCGDVTQFVHTGTNWLFIEDGNVVGVAGLLFSATITTTAISVPSINAGGIVNNAGSTSPVAPGSLASVYGAFPVSSASQATGVPLPTTLSGLSMQFSGIAVPLLYASPNLANVQVPWELTGQTQALATATVSNQTSAPQTVNLAPVAPGIFTPILDASYRIVDSSNPAIPGTTYIQIYCTGLGPVTNQPATGAAAPTSPLAQTTTTPIVTIGGVRAQVLYSGLTPTTVGLYQVNVLVSTVTPSGNSVPVVISIGGATTSNTATIAVQSTAPSNPAPTITSLSPSSALSGSAPITLTINGTGFVSSSSATYNGIAHPVSFVSGTQVTISLIATDLATAGSFSVIVTNPAPGGGNSQPATFTVTAPVPISFTGNWTGAWGSIPSGAFGSLSATLTEDASAPAAYIQGLPAYSVTGTITLNSSPCFSVVPVSGLIAGNTFAFIPTFAVGPQVTFDGMLNASGTAVSSGAYAVKSGLCMGDYGIFTATKN